ncbi:MAG: RtcB family protein [Candidatus Diapherotrites archaeon]|nr:RtcB family protein [Candidatus Diapherotrites archaeon]
MTEIKKLSNFVWEIPKEKDMTVPARLYVDEKMKNFLLEEEKSDWSTLGQLKNLSTLPGIEKYAIALPDCHPGYGAPIGSVVANNLENGVITFGTVGFDINCGVYMISTPLNFKQYEKKKFELANELYKVIPAGLGEGGKIRLTKSDVEEYLVKGAELAVKEGHGLKADLEFLEENGRIKGANIEAVSEKAKERGKRELGTLGSGNHYFEVQLVDQVMDEKTAKAFGLWKGQVVVMLHCGSRGLGHQIGTEYIQYLNQASQKYNIPIKHKELVCAPIQSQEGQQYLSAINCGINYAFANRIVLANLGRQAFSKIYGIEEKEIKTVYNVAHNTAKIEKHEIDGKHQKVLVQRKGSTRAFAAGSKDLPKKYQKFGHPVLVGGTMGTYSYVLVGTEKGMQETFGSTVHGAGRMLSRAKAMGQFKGETIVEELTKKGIIVKGHSVKGIAEEAPNAYKRVEDVIRIVEGSGINKAVVRTKPLIVVKG